VNIMDDRGEKRGVRERIVLKGVFAGAAVRYWLIVFPAVCHELRRLRHSAGEIPDPVLRGLALDALAKRGNIEGAAAFAAFAPPARRGAVLRGLVAFQAAYNYLDMLAEQPSADAVENGHRLHQALLVCVDPDASHLNYYERCPWNDDGGYLLSMIEACRAALAELPSYAAVAPAASRAGGRIAAFQSLHLSRAQGGHEGLELWARTQTPAASGLQWWETAASAGSSLGVFALVALAGEDHVATEHVAAVEQAYFPWIGALHSLLDNLVDRCEDEENGQRSLVEYYASSADAARRMEGLADTGSRLARALPGGPRYTLVLAAMASYYLSMPEASEPEVRPISRAVQGAIGGPARAALTIFRLRRLVDRLRHRAPVIKDRPVAVEWRNGWGRVV
jgi:tetraprenyl-beta-curcumene synthase